MSKKYNFYFYVTNVFFDAGERGECMETFLGPRRLEKSSKITLHFSESITIGNSIQMDIGSTSLIMAIFGEVAKTAREVTSLQGFLELSLAVQTPYCYAIPAKRTRRTASGGKNKVL